MLLFADPDPQRCLDVSIGFCRKVFEHELEPVLGRHGFHGWFLKKGGQVDEGLACFYSTARFTLQGILMKQHLPFNILRSFPQS
jgi:hypothetical protein